MHETIFIRMENVFCLCAIGNSITWQFLGNTITWMMTHFKRLEIMKEIPLDEFTIGWFIEFNQSCSQYEELYGDWLCIFSYVPEMNSVTKDIDTKLVPDSGYLNFCMLEWLSISVELTGYDWEALELTCYDWFRYQEVVFGTQ